MIPKLTELVVLIKGGGEVASAVAHKLACSHFRVCLTEIPSPRAIHRGTSFCEAIYEGEKEVERITAELITSPEEVFEVWAGNKIPIICDPEASIKDFLHPDVLIDAIMAKRNLSTKITDATLVIGLGPGFEVGVDAYLIIETNNSENLGKVILQGKAEEDTGVPPEIGGFTYERVLRAPKDGRLSSQKKLGEKVSEGEVVAFVEDEPVITQIGGIIRGMLREGTKVKEGTKFGELDPRSEESLCYTIRPRMRTIAGGVLEAIMNWFNKEGR